MICVGKVYCEIYRDKKYCSKATAGNHQPCDCRHAAAKCDVARCAAEDDCPILKIRRGENA